MRLAELLAALSLGIDLGFGQPMEHVLRQCRIALRIAELVGLDEDTRSSIYYSALLVNVGCHTDAHEQARWFGDDIALKATKYGPEQFTASELLSMLRLLGSGSTPLHRIRVGLDFAISGRKEVDGMVDRHAALARALGEELSFGAEVLDALSASYARWDGRGVPGGLGGDAIPLASRIVHLAEFVEVAHRNDGIDGAIDLAQRRSGSQFDPQLVDVVVADAEKVFQGIDDLDSWGAVIDGEPALAHLLTPAECDEALAAIGRYVDLKSPCTAGHSAAVALLAEATAVGFGLPDTDRQLLRRAGLVSGFGPTRCVERDLGQGRLAQLPRSGNESGSTRRTRSGCCAAPRRWQGAGRLAGQVAERLDGSGYPGGLAAGALSSAQPDPRDGSDVPDQARGTTTPAGPQRGRDDEGAPRRGPCRPARRRRRRWRAARRGRARPAPASRPRWTHRPRDRGAAVPGARPVEPGDREDVGDQSQDR